MSLPPTSADKKPSESTPQSAITAPLLRPTLDNASMLATSRSLIASSRASAFSPSMAAFRRAAVAAPAHMARISTSTPAARAAGGGVTDPDAAKPTLEIDPFAKAARLNRPMSPHLSIYKWELTMIGSIMHRATGGAGSAIFYSGAIWYALAPFHSATVVNLAHSLPVPMIIAAKVLLAGPIVYHSLNGIRHLTWDTAKALKVPDVFNTGYIVLAGTAIGTAYLALQ
ncbi:succinate dehydrogenase cytochrome b560 subunit [Geranomyces variabilis]|nr:succinate dehydrogenase cytochrome b560 subunit [Geranomyces variabilis]KAJ3137829.1 cytochrome b subunit of succinate dehydrogenase, Sdh3p [Geranomyces variabilis]